MQEVSLDGIMGQLEDFDMEKLKESLLKPTVDHVRVFNKETGGKVIMIETEQLKRIIIEAVNTAFEKRDIEYQYEKLTKKTDILLSKGD